jgi:hypothetical protein
MEKVADWNGMTQSHGFSVEVFHDATSRMFIARIHTSSPPLMPQHIPGSPTPMMKFDDLEEIKNEGFEQVRELTKKLITDRCGKILRFLEKSAF